MAVIAVNYQNLQHNLDVVKQLAPRSKVIAMIKANAYGHGLLDSAKALSAANALGVARTSEALKLRAAGIKKLLVVFSGFNCLETLRKLSENNCGVVVHSLWQAQLLAETKLAKPVTVFLKLNTGMNRLGMSADEFTQAYELLLQSPNVKGELIFMTHFSDADDLTNDKTKQQLKLFLQATQDKQGQRTTAGSSAIISFPESHLDWVRPGIMLYGASPFADRSALELGLKPVMTFTAPVIAIYDFPAGSEIGYGSTYRCEKDTRVAVVAVGYGDGYPRHAQTGTPVYLNGQRCRLLGRVSMDMITVELPKGLEVEVGDEAELWGDNLAVNEVAAHATTISYELLSSVAPRLARLV